MNKGLGITAIALVAVIMGLSTVTPSLSQAFAQVEVNCVVTDPLSAFSWNPEPAVDGDPDHNGNGFVCLLSFGNVPLPRIVIDDL